MPTAVTTGGLPAEVSTFVGRRQELTEVRRLLKASRMVTLVGTGGVGKTRLAMRAARQAGHSFAGGVAFVELAGLAEAALLVPVVGEAVGWAGQQEGLSATALGKFLADRELLLVLDNCEHLVNACAALCAVVLESAPEARVLATSRRSLRVAGERVMPVPPLAVPRRPVGAGEAAAVWDAVALFVDRARAQVPSFALADDNVGEVVELCRRLEGLPLALELAASRLRTQPVSRLLRGLERPGMFLGEVTNRRPAARQHSLENLIAWSYRLLTPREQTVLARLCVFVGGTDPEAAERVCAGDGIEAEDVSEALVALVDHSLVTHDEHGRYRILEMIRRFGLQELAEAGDEGRTRRRHRDYYKDLAAQGAADWFGPRQGEWAAWLQRERANLHAALDHSLTSLGESGNALTLTVDLWHWWSTRVEYAEAQYWLERALAADPRATVLRSHALARAAITCAVRGGFPFADAWADEALTIAEDLDDQAALSWAVLAAALAAFYQGKWDSADRLFGQLEANPVTSPGCLAVSLSTHSVAAGMLGRTGDVVAFGERSLELCEQHGDHRFHSLALVTLGWSAWQSGEHQRAADLCRRSLHSQRQLGVLSLAYIRALEILGWITAETGAPAVAARLLGAAEAAGRNGGTDGLAEPVIGFREQALRAIRATLTEQQLQSALAQGRSLDREEAIALALGGEEAIARPLGGSASVPRGEREPEGTGGLTAREREVAHLVAQGLTSRQIASRLVISPRTAEGHIQRIMAKLGFTARTQITAWSATDVPREPRPPT